MWLLLAFGSAVFAALVAIFAKLGLSGISSTLATTVRSIIMALFLLGVSLAFRKFDGFSLHALTGKQWSYIILAGIAGALSWLCYFAAIKIGNVPKVVAIDRTSVLFVLAFSILVLGDALTWKSAAGAALIAGGAILMTIK
mgnify:CR=1 FL=1